jgi:hypothetical protein
MIELEGLMTVILRLVTINSHLTIRSFQLSSFFVINSELTNDSVEKERIIVQRFILKKKERFPMQKKEDFINWLMNNTKLSSTTIEKYL